MLDVLSLLWYLIKSLYYFRKPQGCQYILILKSLLVRERIDWRRTLIYIYLDVRNPDLLLNVFFSVDLVQKIKHKYIILNLLSYQQNRSIIISFGTFSGDTSYLFIFSFGTFSGDLSYSERSRKLE